MSTLSFYDFNRQDYAENFAAPPHGEDEFMIGGYSDDAGVDERGEFAIVLHRFHDETTLSAQVRAFDDSFAALRECIDLGLLDALESVAIYTPDDLTGILTDLGLRDRSHKPLKAA
jgi:hypothetical protein